MKKWKSRKIKLRLKQTIGLSHVGPVDERKENLMVAMEIQNNLKDISKT